VIETSPHRPSAIVPLPARRGRPPGEAGSAYIIVLLVLVVLTILGLSLALVTQTERQIGVSERTVQRVFASAESGIYLAVAKMVLLHDANAMNLELREPRRRLDGTADPTLGNAPLQRHDLSVSVMMPLLDSYANLTQINRGGNTDPQYKEINYGLISTATRRGWTGSDSAQAAVLGRQSLSAMVEIQPIPGDQTDAARTTVVGNIDDGTGTRQLITDNPF
jgi:hypothetical protein